MRRLSLIAVSPFWFVAFVLAGVVMGVALGVRSAYHDFTQEWGKG